MAYIGRGVKDLSDRLVLDSITVTATDTFTLQSNSVDFVPSSASALTVSLNGIIQKPDSSYTVSSSSIIFSSALTTDDTIDFIIAERGITLQTPSAGSVGTSQLASNAVTSAKMFSGFANGITMADSWRLTASFNTNDSFVTSNWERVDTYSYGTIGTGLTESSGTFSFAQTGIYVINYFARMSLAASDTTVSMDLYTTEDNSTYNQSVIASSGNGSSGTGATGCAAGSFILDVTNTTNVKFKFGLGSASTNSGLQGNTSNNRTYFNCYRLGDT